MKIPTLTGTIERRILINYQVDAQVLTQVLPAPFRPKLVNGKGIAGICLIRLKHIRPKGLPKAMGIRSENGAHRIAVEWTQDGQTREGVYVPRRDTSSKLNVLAGGRFFPGVHHLADFTVREKDGRYEVAFKSEDGTFVSIRAQETDSWNAESVFENPGCASDFFRQGTMGYSPGKVGHCFDGLELRTYRWEVTPLSVMEVRSSFFEDEKRFPAGSIRFDNALLMRNIEHEWHQLRETPAGVSAVQDL